MNRWHHVLVTHDGSGKAEGVRLLVDGAVQESRPLGDTLTDTISTSNPLYLGKGHPGAMLKGRIDEVRIYDRVLSDEEVAELPTLEIDAIELDIRAHSGELWVIHDLDLERLTGSSGRFDTWEDPASLRLLNGESIPKLRQVLDLMWASRFRDDHIPRGVTQKKAPTEAGVFCCAVQA